MKKINNQKFDEFSKNNIEPLLIVLFVILLVNNTGFFYKAYHDIDLTYNFNKVSGDLNTYFCDKNTTIVLSDTGTDYQDRSLTTYYLSALNKIDNKYFFGIIYALFLGILISRRL